MKTCQCHCQSVTMCTINNSDPETASLVLHIELALNVALFFKTKAYVSRAEVTYIVIIYCFELC